MFTLKQRYVYLLPFLTLTMKEATGIYNCSSHSDCTHNKYCCTMSFNPLWKICRVNCVQKLCRSKKDCGSGDNGDECCTYSNKCSTWKPDCDCRRNKVCEKMDLYCCKQRYLTQKSVCRANCTEQACHEDQVCAPKECCSRTYRCTKDKHTCLEVCNTNSNCFNSIRPYCCGHRYTPRYCSNTCLSWKCRSDSDCGEPQQCCVDNRCTNSDCMDVLSSLKIVIILASVVVFAIICTVVFVACYRKRRGRCVFLQPRTRDETMELRADPQLPRESTQNLPPPPYSIVDQPFPPSQNQDFPPIYELQDSPT